jgi:SAM-dependent methyltransferase
MEGVVAPVRSPLDAIYSMSSRMTGREVAQTIDRYDELSQRMHREFAAFVDPYTSKVKAGLAHMRTACPLCGNSEFRFLFTKHGFDHALCANCDLIFTVQVLDPEKTRHLEEADDGDTYGELKSGEAVTSRDRLKFEHVFGLLARYRGAPIRRLLDVGSNVGTFLHWASRHCDVIGHEYHSRLRARCEKLGHPVLSEPLDMLALDRPVDVITCWDYLDHLQDPRAVVRNLSRHLTKGGVFFFAINNRYSLSARMLHEHSPIFIGPQHTMHFGVPQLVRLMEGYELVYHESYVSELNWISNWLNFENPETGDAPLMFELFDPARVCELGMGFKVNAMFRRA